MSDHYPKQKRSEECQLLLPDSGNDTSPPDLEDKPLRRSFSPIEDTRPHLGLSQHKKESHVKDPNLSQPSIQLNEDLLNGGSPLKKTSQFIRTLSQVADPTNYPS